MLSDKRVKATTEKAITVDSSDRDRVFLASWLFLIGSLIFLVDGFIELAEGISIHVLLHLSASCLFTIGSILFIPTDKTN